MIIFEANKESSSKTATLTVVGTGVYNFTKPGMLVSVDFFNSGAADKLYAIGTTVNGTELYDEIICEPLKHNTQTFNQYFDAGTVLYFTQNNAELGLCTIKIFILS